MASGLVDQNGRALPSSGPREVGCDNCGRGSLRVSIAGTAKPLDTSLIVVPCTNKPAHEPGGSHVGKCAGPGVGNVYIHKNPHVCIAVKQASRN
jgi:hypothetical protein